MIKVNDDEHVYRDLLNGINARKDGGSIAVLCLDDAGARLIISWLRQASESWTEARWYSHYVELLHNDVATSIQFLTYRNARQSMERLKGRQFQQAYATREPESNIETDLYMLMDSRIFI